MTDPFEREVAVFNAARHLSAEERSSYLDEACAGDAALRRAVEKLLRAHADAASFLDGLAPGADWVGDDPSSVKADAARLGEQSGDRIGRYKLLRVIGEGGCGVVYLAEQEEPVRRKVALKVIKLGTDTRQVIGRFEAERQALALMDHPNIAKVFDAGATNSGRPFFVMELVEGSPITRYCDEKRLDTRQRLRLLIEVCRAIQHAHQKGIIHRDIKPSNILISETDDRPVPKVIDFGIAKATDHQQLTDKTIFTAFEQFIGTPAYMSPEQARLSSTDIDTRSDIYSLGVLAYELMTGKTPFDGQQLIQAGLAEVCRIIRDEEPPRPSTRLSALDQREQTTVAQARQADPPMLVGMLRGDLDWIVMKALEKDRNLRYPTANALAMEFQRFLDDEVVLARPPSYWDRLRKSVRRHKGAFAAASSIMAILVLGLVASGWEALRATRAEKQQHGLLLAAQRAEQAEREQRRTAEAARAEEARQRVFTAEMELLARRRFYAAQISLAGQAVEAGQLGRALTLLETQRPKAAVYDLRTFEWYYLRERCRSGPTQPLPGRAIDGQFRLGSEPVDRGLASLFFSPDGQRVLGVLERCTAGMNLLSGQESRALLGAAGKGALSPDGKLLATGDRAGTINLWDEATGQLMTRVQGHTSAITAVVFAANGGILVTCASNEPALKAWDPAAGLRLLWTTNAGATGIWTLAVSPDGHTVAAAIGGQRVDFFDVATGRHSQGFQAERDPDEVSALAFSPNGNFLAVGGQSGRTRLWRLEIGRALLDALEGHAGAVQAIAFSPDGGTVATGSDDQTVRLWDAATGQERLTLKGFHEGVRAVTFSPDGNTLMAGSVGGQVRFWRAMRAPDATAFFKPTLDWVQQAADTNNSAAWTLATDPDADKRDGVKAVELAQKAVTATNRKNPEYLGTLAAAYAEKGDFTNAVSVQLEAIARLPGEQHKWDQAYCEKQRSAFAARLPLYEKKSPYREPISATVMADRRIREGKDKEAEALLRAELARSAGLSITNGEVYLLGAIVNELIEDLRNRAMLAQARAVAEEAFATDRRHPEWPMQEHQRYLLMLERVLWDLGDLATLEKLFNQELVRTRPGSEVSYLGLILHHLAAVLLERHRLPEARAFAEQAVEIYRRHPEWPFDEQWHALFVLSDVLAALGNPGDLEPVLREQLRVLGGRLEPDHPQRAVLLARLALTLLQEKKFVAAEQPARECLTIREKTLPDDWATFNARSLLGGALLGQTNYADAEPLLVSGYEGMKQRQETIPESGKMRLTEAVQRLAQLYKATQRFDRAAKLIAGTGSD